MHPSKFGLPHDKFRKYQLPTILWLRGQKGNIVLQAPTGSGKSSFARAMASSKQTVSLVQTKSLQIENYGKMYNFDVLMGKSNYKCAHSKTKNGNLTCSDCLYKNNMNQCPFNQQCSYLQAKWVAYESNKASINYAYYLTTNHFKQNPPKVLVMDECHLLSSVVLNHVGIRVNHTVKDEFQLPEFPKLRTKDVHFEDGGTAKRALPWVTHSIDVLRDYVKDLKAIADKDDIELNRRIYKASNLQRKLSELTFGLEEFSELWFVHSGDSVLWDKDENDKAPGIIIKPFSARFHFPSLFLQAETTLMMSATVGNPEVFANELGISEYQFRHIPQVYDAPIYDLQCPNLNKRSSEKDLDKQAKMIADAIGKLNSEWSGIIHVNAKSQALELEARLSHYLGDRVSATPQMGTNEILEWWEYDRKLQCPNAIMIAWSLWEGVDLLNDKICIVAKVPYASLGDAYTQLRVQRNPQFYRLETAWKLVQGLGRIRRGRKEDYDPGANFVAIADSNYTQLLPYIDDSVKKNVCKL